MVQCLYIHMMIVGTVYMMCVDKQNSVCLRQLVTYRKIMCVHAIFLFQ